MYFDPAAPSLPHHPLKAILGPRPIGWISTLAADGSLSLSPYSFYTALSETLVGFSSAGRKDAITHIEACGEFVCNLVTHDLREAMNATSAPLPRGSSEFDHAGLSPAPSLHVRPPRVASAPAAIECRWQRTVPLTGADASAPTHFLVIGEVVAIYLDDRFVANGRVDTAAMRPVLRGGYFDYFEVSAADRFEMRRPAGAGDFLS